MGWEQEERFRRELIIELREIQGVLREGFSVLAALLRHQHPAHNPAARLVLTIGGRMSDVSLSVDVTGEVAAAQFVDDKGDTGATPPNGPDGAASTIQYSSSDPSVVTVDPSSGALSFLKAGSAQITATAVDSAGTPIANFPTASANLTLTPGAAVGLQVSVEGAPPVPAPGT